MKTTILNVMYMRPDCRDDEVRRLDDVELQPGRIIWNRCCYDISPIGHPEYSSDPQTSGCVVLLRRWLCRPVVGP